MSPAMSAPTDDWKSALREIERLRRLVRVQAVEIKSLRRAAA